MEADWAKVSYICIVIVNQLNPILVIALLDRVVEQVTDNGN